MYHIFFIHSSVKGHLGCFQVLDIIDKAAMNRIEPMSFEYMPKSDIVGSNGAGITGCQHEEE